ncbi:MAG: peptidoglycan bridge formation glycyltransferase FemA/FemB family protein [Micrococcaceae bacterium]
MFTVKKLTSTKFEDIAQANPKIFIPIEQSPEYDEYDRIMGGRQLLGIYGYYHDDQLVATTRLTYFTLRMRNILLCVKGPVWFTEQTAEREEELVDTMKDYFVNEEKLNITFIRMWLTHQVSGANESFEQFLADREIWVDINPKHYPDEESLMLTFSKTTRQNIRKGLRNEELEIKEITDLDERVNLFDTDLMSIMNETQSRNNFYAHPKEIYQALLKALPDKAKLFVAYLSGEAVAWEIITEYHGLATYLFSATNEAARKNRVTYPMLYTAILSSREQGNTLCNLTGIESPKYPGLKNVTEFKRGFSKWEVDLPLTYDIPIKKSQYLFAVKALGASRKLKSLRN